MVESRIPVCRVVRRASAEIEFFGSRYRHEDHTANEQQDSSRFERIKRRDSNELLAYVDRDPLGNATRERLGNGGLVTRTVDEASGRQIRQDVRLQGELRHDALYE